MAAAVEATRTVQQGGVLAVKAPPSFASRWLIPRLSRFTERHPDIALRMTGSLQNIDDSPNSPAALPVDPRMDISEVTIRYGNGRYPGHRVTQIFSPVLVPACSPLLLKGEHPLLTPADLRWHILIHDDTVPEQNSERPTWADWLRQAGVDRVCLLYTSRCV